jgi:DNA mismatch endonuclease (patch repair protein)
MLAGMGLRGWKKNACNVTGRPDVVFVHQKVAIFVDGCFWHGCPGCQRKLPQTNREYWRGKIARNVELADSHNRLLRDEGWTVVRIWEHELTSQVARRAIRAGIRRAIESGAVSQ